MMAGEIKNTQIRGAFIGNMAEGRISKRVSRKQSMSNFETPTQVLASNSSSSKTTAIFLLNLLQFTSI